MASVWHPTRWWDWCMSVDEKKEYNQFLLINISAKLSKLGHCDGNFDRVSRNAFSTFSNLDVSKHFGTYEHLI